MTYVPAAWFSPIFCSSLYLQHAVLIVCSNEAANIWDDKQLYEVIAYLWGHSITFCVHVFQQSTAMALKKVLEWLHNWQLLKKGTVP